MNATFPAGVIQVLIWHYTTPQPYPEPTKLHQEWLADLEHNGLLIEDDDGVWRTTARGDLFVRMMLATPMPEQRWVDPREHPG